MHHKTTLTTLLFILFFKTLFAQTSPDLLISSINFEGNKKTQTSFLNRFVESAIGTPLDGNLVDSDKQKLVNLGGVGNGRL